MKVIVDLCVVPIGVGVHLAPYIAACEQVLMEAGLKIQLHPNGTAIEEEWEPVFAAIQACHQAVHAMGCPRIYSGWRPGAGAVAGSVPPPDLALSLRAVELGWLEAEPEQARRQFWLMPLMHSEELAVQQEALPLFERFSDPRTADFPHRNAALGRVSSAAELAFLQTPGSRF